MRKFLKVAALLSVVAVAACGEKTDEGMVDSTAATTDSTMGAMVDTMSSMVDSMGAMVDSMKTMTDTTQH